MMPRNDFQDAVQKIAGPEGWFQQLSPYSDSEPLFALEDVNYKLRDDKCGKIGRVLESGEVVKEFEPLYCLAISAKRYVLFNIVENQTVIRKISGHGLGGLRQLKDYDPKKHRLTKPEHIAAPLDKKTNKRNYRDLAHGSTARLLCDLWRVAVDCFRTGNQSQIDEIIGKLPQLQTPQYSQITLSSTHLISLFPNLPNMRGFQFFVSFPAPRCPPGLNSKYIAGAPYDEHRALCETTLYASLPNEGVTPKLIKEWETTKTGLFRRDNQEFPHGLFDPAWRLSLCTVAQYLEGYFNHSELKSDGEVGELKRKTIISLDKHFIGKETTPLDDDSELIDDGEEPVLECNEMVLRSNDRNLQPLVEAGIEFRRGKRLTYAEMNLIKSSIEIRGDGTLSSRNENDEQLDGDALAWKARLKTWHMLCSFGRFAEISELSKIPLDAINYAARYGDHIDKMDRANLYYVKSTLPYQDFDWQAVRDAIDTLSGHKQRLDELRKLKALAVGRIKTYKLTSKTKAAIAAILDLGYEAVFELSSSPFQKKTGATRMIKQRRNAGVPARYTPKMQFIKLLKEACLFAPMVDASRAAISLRCRQFEAVTNPRKTILIARKNIIEKVKMETHEPTHQRAFTDMLKHARSTDDTRHIEAQSAQVWWRQWEGFKIRFAGVGVPTEWRVWTGRYIGRRQGRLGELAAQFTARGAVHPMQAMLNFSVGVLTARMTRVVLAYGLDPVFGFLHDGKKPGRLSLVWDCAELHRPELVRAVFEFAGGRVFRKNDFRMIDDGVVRLAPTIMKEVAALTIRMVSLTDMIKTVEWIARQIRKAGNL